MSATVTVLDDGKYDMGGLFDGCFPDDGGAMDLGWLIRNDREMLGACVDVHGMVAGEGRGGVEIRGTWCMCASGCKDTGRSRERAWRW